AAGPGLSPAVRGAARQHLGAREAQHGEPGAKLAPDTQSVEHEHPDAARARETLSEAEGRMRQREEALRQREETFRRRLNEELDAQVRTARREIDDIIGTLKTKTSQMAEDAARHTRDVMTTGETGATRSDARAAVDMVVER